MISRVAESCFWLGRYMERAEAMARLLEVNGDLWLENREALSDLWRQTLDSQGCLNIFRKDHGATATRDSERVQNYLTWTEGGGVSIHFSMRAARENARTIREVISLEAFNQLNETWLWLTSKEASSLYSGERSLFYQEVKVRCQAFHGIMDGTMMHGEGWHFFRLGVALARAHQSLRILDLRFSEYEPKRTQETALDAAIWRSLLRTLSASESWSKRGHETLSAQTVADFLLKDRDFPRSVAFCMQECYDTLRRITGRGAKVGRRSLRKAAALNGKVKQETTERWMKKGLREIIGEMLDESSQLGVHIEEDFFRWDSPAAGEAA